METLITEITSGQKKQINRLAEDAIDRAIADNIFNKSGAQELLKRGDEFQADILASIKRLSTSNQFEDEEVSSNYAYPKEYKGPKSICEQVECLLKHFPKLDAGWALNDGQKWYNQLSLPNWVEGPLVYIWWEAFGGYNIAIEQILEKVALIRNFYNYRSGKLGNDYLRQHERTARMEATLKKYQPGDLIIVPNQAGSRWAGRSVRRVGVLYERNEFGLGSVAENCRAISHPERFVRWEQLHVDCAGDEYSPYADGDFSHAPYLYFLGSQLRFGADRVGIAYDHYGSASAFLPQQN